MKLFTLCSLIVLTVTQDQVISDIDTIHDEIQKERLAIKELMFEKRKELESFSSELDQLIKDCPGTEE